MLPKLYCLRWERGKVQIIDINCSYVPKHLAGIAAIGDEKNKTNLVFKSFRGLTFLCINGKIGHLHCQVLCDPMSLGRV